MGERWAGPGGTRVWAVRLAGAHRVWADLAGIAGDAGHAFLVVEDGRLVGYFASVEDLAEAVDLAALRPD